MQAPLQPLHRDVFDFYNGSKVVIVGGAGMVGHQLVGILRDIGAKPIVIDNFSRGKNILSGVYYALRCPAGGIDLVPGDDLRDQIKEGYSVFGIDVGLPTIKSFYKVMEGSNAVFNLAAAVAGVLHNEKSHLQMFQDNANLQAGPLRAAELAGVPAFLQTSSVCVYAEHNQSPCLEARGHEGEPHPANAGYAHSKRVGEKLLEISKIPFGVIVRPSNITGEADYFDELAHVIPAFVKRAEELKRGATFKAYGAAMIQREFIYSWDVAAGMLTALAKGENREAYNIGTSGADRHNTVSMRTLASKIIDEVHRQLGRDKEEVRIMFDASAGGGDSVRYSDSRKLQALGWRHLVDLDNMIERVVDYYLRTPLEV